MSQIKAKLFNNGRSQAVRLPVKFRFEGTEVYIRKDPKTGDVILSRKPANWDEFLVVRDPDDPDTAEFLLDRADGPPQKRELF
jgi:antitoxin VapB